MKLEKVQNNASAAEKKASESGRETAKPVKKTAKESPFADLPGYRQLQKRFLDLQKHNLANPFFLPHESVNGSTVLRNGREFINYAGYNYLGLSGHPKVSHAAKDAIDRYGTSVSASRIVSGQIPLHEELERRIAEFLDVEDCLVYISGYGTNVSTIGYLFGRNDLVIHDSLSHNSIITGCKLSEAKRMSFPHSDWEQLDNILTAQRDDHKRVLIAAEALYSMDGDVLDLPSAVNVKKKHDALMMVDEAHSLGTLGKTGRGIAEHTGVAREDVDIWMGTLSKTFASAGGFIAGDKELIEYLRYLGPGFIFSVGLPPADTAAALAALELLEKEPQRVDQLRARARLFRDLAKDHGIEVHGDEDTPIIPVIIGDSHVCMDLSFRLLEAGVNVRPIVYPAVSANGARLRFFITSTHTEEQIKYTVSRLAEEMDKMDSEGAQAAE